jgi:N-acetylneuraminate synthase
MINLLKKFGTLVGLSDHTIGNEASIVATTLGVSAIEKHFTLSRSNKSEDNSFSTEPKGV